MPPGLRSAGTALIACALAGCAAAPAPRSGSGAPEEGATVRCNAQRCRVAVDATAAGTRCDVTAPTPDHVLEIPSHVGGQPNRDVVIIWRAPQGFGFCPGDGVRFKSDASQFRDGWSTDDPDGAPDTSTHCKRHFRWTDVNTARGRFPYGVLFTHTGSGARCFLDPFIFNN